MITVCAVLLSLLVWQSPSSTEVQQRITALKARAESGDAKAQVELGIAYAAGDGVTADDAEAVQWFRKAAEKGDPAGEYSLGRNVSDWTRCPPNIAEAAKWIRPAAEAGEPRGQFNLAVMYSQEEGQGVPKRRQ